MTLWRRSRVQAKSRALRSARVPPRTLFSPLISPRIFLVTLDELEELLRQRGGIQTAILHEGGVA